MTRTYSSNKQQRQTVNQQQESNRHTPQPTYSAEYRRFSINKNNHHQNAISFTAYLNMEPQEEQRQQQQQQQQQRGTYYYSSS
jgi:hypothetical protein